MKFTLTFKTPDVVDDTIKDYQDTNCGKEEHDGEHDPSCDDCVAIEDRCCESISNILECTKKFIRHGEYVSIEFDTDAGTATVLKVK